MCEHHTAYSIEEVRKIYEEYTDAYLDAVRGRKNEFIVTNMHKRVLAKIYLINTSQKRVA